MAFICECGSEVAPNLWACGACGRPAGYPNVKLATSPSETDALAARLHDAEVSCSARGCKAQLDDFGEHVKTSKAVIARPFAVVDDLVNNETSVYTNYQRQVFANTKVPANNDWDKTRTQYESALFPNFHMDMLFAALTLSGVGVSGYGPCSMILKDKMISHRASVFEENPTNFIERHQILLNKPLPAGYRASWENRHMLAKAKLHSEIQKTTTAPDYPGILQHDRGGTGDSDFIEVHIHGTFNRNAIEKITASTPRDAVDAVLWKRIMRVARKIGAEVKQL